MFLVDCANLSLGYLREEQRLKREASRWARNKLVWEKGEEGEQSDWLCVTEI